MKLFKDLSKLRKMGGKKKVRFKPGVLLRVYKVFGRHYKKYWKVVTASFLSLLATIATVMLVPWPLKLILDYVILGQPLPESLTFLNPLMLESPQTVLLILAVSIVVLAILEAIFSYMNKFWISSTGHRINADIRERVFAHLQRLSLSFHSASHSGDVVYMLTSDMPKMKDVLVDFPQEFLFRTITFISAMAIMVSLDWRLGAIALGAVPLLAWFINYYGTGMNKAMKKSRKKEGAVASIISENVTAMALVQAYGREESERARFNKENQESLLHKLKTLRMFKTYGRVADFLIILSTGGVLYFGGMYALGGTVLPGTLVVFLAYMREIYGIVQSLTDIFFKLATSLVSCEKLVDLVENDMIVKDEPAAVPLENVEGKITFDNVSFAYKKAQNVLSDLNFEVAPGETIALIGHSGAGKSTLISLLLRFYDPQSGEIRIDGQPINQFTVKSLREQITILLQDANLFQMSVYENIAFGNPDADREMVIAAAKLAQAHDFIMDMPEGYDTLMTEGGNNLSGGQKQRINIARAIIRNKPIVILDEPSTGLDARAELKLNEAIHHLTEKRTTFIIAHKFASIASADKILLLDEGQLAHLGTHEQLLSESAQYRELYELQFGSKNRQLPGKTPQEGNSGLVDQTPEEKEITTGKLPEIENG